MIRVGIVGVGGMGTTHADKYRQMDDVELSFYDSNESRKESFQARFGVSAHQTMDDLLSNVDVVDLCLPTDIHCEFALMAISAGNSVYIEKPLARTLEQGAKIVEAAQGTKATVGIGQVVRYFHEFSTGNRLVKAGRIGTPAAARMRRGGGAPKGTDLWFMDHERSGGVLLDLGIHDFDWLRWTLGEVNHVYSKALSGTRKSGPDYALTTLTFESGCVAHVESTWMDPSGFRVTFEVCGDGGMIEYDSQENAFLKSTTSESSVREMCYAPKDDPYYLELRAFVDAVKLGSHAPVTAEDAFRSLAIALAAVESSKTGKAVQPNR